MSPNKITPFIKNNLVLTLVTTILVSSGISALAFSAINSRIKPSLSSITISSKSFSTSSQARSNSASSLTTSSSIMPSSTIDNAKKEIAKVTETEKPKLIEGAKKLDSADTIGIQDINKIEVKNLILTNVRVGGIDPQGKVTLSDSTGRIVLFGPKEPYYPPANLDKKASFSGLLKQRKDIGENVFEPINGFLTDISSTPTAYENGNLIEPRTDTNNGMETPLIIQNKNLILTGPISLRGPAIIDWSFIMTSNDGAYYFFKNNFDKPLNDSTLIFNGESVCANPENNRCDGNGFDVIGGTLKPQ